MLADESGYYHNFEQESIRTWIYFTIVFLIGSGITSIFIAKATEGKWDKCESVNQKAKDEEEPLYVPLLFVGIVLAWAFTLYDPSGMNPI
eukprot:473160_1